MMTSLADKGVGSWSFTQNDLGFLILPAQAGNFLAGR
jgi:hypothetical protein